MRLFTKTAAVAVVLTGYSVIGVPNANASAINTLIFGGTGTEVTATNDGLGTTTINISGAVTIGTVDGGVVTDAAFINATFTNDGAGTVSAGTLLQLFSGNLCITSEASCGGTNYLTSNGITDLTFSASGVTSGAASGGLSGTNGGTTHISFTSSVISDIDLAEVDAISLSFAAIAPSITGTEGSPASTPSFTSSVSGNFFI